MQKPLLVFVITLFVSIATAYSQTKDWVVKVGTTGFDEVSSVTTDRFNNYYELINYSSTLALDSLGTPKSISQSGGTDALLVKYNCSGVFQWAFRISSSASDKGNAVRVDTNGNVFIVGHAAGAITFYSSNGIPSTKSISAPTSGFLVKVNNSGIFQWAIQVYSNSGTDELKALTIGGNQGIYITGSIENATTVESIGSSSVMKNTVGKRDILVAEYSQTGMLVYATNGGSSEVDGGNAIAVDSTGSAYVAGYFGATASVIAIFGGNAISNSGNYGAFICKVDNTGAFVWGNGMGSGNYENFHDVLVDENSNRIIVVGQFTGTSTVTTRPGGSAINLSSSGSYDGVIAAMDFNGATLWGRKIGGTGVEVANKIALDSKLNLLVSGSFSSTTNFGSATSTPPAGRVGIFLAKYTVTNSPVSVIQIGSTDQDTVLSLNVSPANRIFLSGSFNSSLISGIDFINGAGSWDGFVFQFSDQDSLMLTGSKSLIQCFGDSSILYLPGKSTGSFEWYRNDTLVTVTAGNFIKTNNPGTYKVKSISNCNPDVVSQNFILTKSPYYSIPSSADLNICRGDSGRIYASGGSGYYWSPGTGLSDSTISNPIVKPSATTIYYLTATQPGCIAKDTIQVNVSTNCCLTCSTPYSISQGLVACYPFNGNLNDESGYSNNATAFNGVTLTQDRFGVNNKALQFNGVNQYLEIPNSSSLASPAGNLSITFWARVNSWIFNAGVQYTPILSKSNSTSSAQYRAMIRTNGAYAMANGKSWNGIAGSVTSLNQWYFFSITTSNDTMYYYRNGTLLGYAVGPTAITLNSTTPLRLGRNDVNTQAYFYGRLDEVRIYNRTLTAAEVKFLFDLSNINGLPTINAGVDKNICKGDSVRLTTTGTAGTYLWNPSAKLSSDTARSPYSKADTTTNYVVRVNYSGCFNYDTVKVNVVNFQPDAGLDQGICKGDTARIIVLNGGNTFSWSPNYKITGLTNDTALVFPLVDTSYIVASSNGVCVRRDTVRITINVPVLNAGPDVTVCPDDTARFTTLSNGYVRWFPLTYLSDSIGTGVYAVPDSEMTYYVSANYYGCMAYDTVRVSVARLPIDAGPDKLICKGDSAQLNASGGLNYIWLPALDISDTAVSDPIVYPPTSRYYYAISYNTYCSRYDSVFIDVREADAKAGPDRSICDGDSVVLAGSAIGPYHWSPTTSLSDTLLTPYARPTSTTQYILSVNNGGCLDSDTVMVNVSVFHINAGKDTIVCRGDSVQLFASGGVKYNWLPNYNINDTGISNPYVKPLGPTNYFLISSNGVCVRTDTVFVDVKTINASGGSDTSICKGGSVVLSASGGLNYTWLTNYNISSVSIPNPTVSPATDTFYVVKISDGVICSIYDSVKVKVDAYPIVNAGPDLKHCPDASLTINADVKSYTYLTWVPSLYLSDKLVMKPDVSVKGRTTYALNAWNRYCFASDTLVVDVNPPVIADFTASSKSGYTPLPVTFTNTSKNAYFFTWVFDSDGNGSNSRDGEFIYTKAGSYYVLLTAKDSLGCMDTLSTTILVEEKVGIMAPGAFTPNGDGLNDQFEFYYNPDYFEKVEYEIYNRWGILVYSTRMPGGTWWDGKVNGIPEPSGLYTYVGSAKDTSGKTYRLEGAVTLIR